MNVLNPVRRVRYSFIDFAFRHMGLHKREFFGAVEQHLKLLHLAPAVLSAYPHELSGGMRQRVAIALATICRPEFIIADEPTTALDVVVQKDVLAMIREAQQQIGSSMIFVTHDMTVHANIADRLGIMYAGRLVEEAPTAEIFHSPMHPYTQHLVASLPRIGDRTQKAALSGAPPSLADPPSGCRFHPRCPLAMDICRRAHPELTTIAPGRRVACYAVSPPVKPAGEVDAPRKPAAGAPARVLQ
jgi:peptide/nickel transport system ATP-binding protein